jgi:formylglycine-generating enzyme required for sulfatase activity
MAALSMMGESRGSRRRWWSSFGSVCAVLESLGGCQRSSTSMDAEPPATLAVNAPSAQKSSDVAMSKASTEGKPTATAPTVRPVASAPAATPPTAATPIAVPAGKVLIDGKETSVQAFAIDRTEVTVADYARCFAARRCTAAAQDDIACNWTEQKTRAEHPINCVTVKQAKQYCEANGKRLPTAAEWQLAAGGPEGQPYPWGSAHPSNMGLPDHVPGTDFAPGPARRSLCWVGDETAKGEKYPTGTCKVGSYPAGDTPTGVADLAGNVAEWTSTTQKLPHGDQRYVVKGGGYNFDPVGRLEVAVVDVTLHDDAHQAADVGFRCVTASNGPSK